MRSIKDVPLAMERKPDFIVNTGRMATPEI
jgi:hypothetical protein